MTSIPSPANGVLAYPAREAATWLIRLARIGYAAKGIVYGLIGLLAARLASGLGGEATDTTGALRTIDREMFGDASLLVIGIGLAGYCVFQLISAATNSEGKSRDTKGALQRLGQAWRGLVYGALGVTAFRLLARDPQRSNGAEDWTARALDAPAGRWIVLAVAAGIAIYAGWQFYRAAAKDLVKRFETERMSEMEVRTAVWVGRIGIAARAVVFLIMSWFLYQAARTYDAREAGGIAESLATIVRQPYGRAMLLAIGVGLLAYGAYMLLSARYRRMRVT